MPLRLNEESFPATKCVMVVDDDPVIRLVLSEAMRDAGFHVIEASCSADAMSYLRSGASVDLIFSDIQMAGPHDGLLLAHQVRGIDSTLPVILTSSGDKPASLSETEIFIRKPYRLDHIVALVMMYLDTAGIGAK
jgi:CheY-like chemotaxis protein